MIGLTWPSEPNVGLYIILYLGSFHPIYSRFCDNVLDSWTNLSMFAMVLQQHCLSWKQLIQGAFFAVHEFGARNPSSLSWSFPYSQCWMSEEITSPTAPNCCSCLPVHLHFLDQPNDQTPKCHFFATAIPIGMLLCASWAFCPGILHQHV